MPGYHASALLEIKLGYDNAPRKSSCGLLSWWNLVANLKCQVMLGEMTLRLNFLISFSFLKEAYQCIFISEQTMMLCVQDGADSCRACFNIRKMHNTHGSTSLDLMAVNVT